MLKFEQLMDGSYFKNAELSESQVASLFDEHATFKEIIRNVIGLDEIDLNIFGNYLYYSFLILVLFLKHDNFLLHLLQ